MEVAAQSPKSITRLVAEEVAAEAAAAEAAAAAAAAEEDGASPSPSPTPKKASTSTAKLPPPPPVVTMSLSMKTVVSPRTHTHEVVALSALVHREVRLDGASDEDGKKVGAFASVPVFAWRRRVVGFELEVRAEPCVRSVFDSVA